MNNKRLTVLCGIFLVLAGSILFSLSPSSVSAQDKPSAAALLKKTLDEKGIEAAKAQKESIKTNKDAYSIDEREFQRKGMDYLDGGDSGKALVMFEAASAFFPNSQMTHRLLAHALYRAGKPEAAFKTQKWVHTLRARTMLKDYLDKNKDTLASTAEEVIARSIEATGGRAAWEAVKTMVVTLTTHGSDGNPNRLVRMYKRPAFFRQGLEGADNFAATDGRTFWRVQKDRWTVNENFHLRLISMDNWLLNFKDYGITCEFVGFHFINGPLYHLRRTFADGYVQDLYFSTVTNVLTEEKGDYISMLPFMKSFMSYWDYREVEGVKLPHVFIRNVGGLEPPHGGVIEDIKINVPLDDSLFVPPDYKK